MKAPLLFILTSILLHHSVTQANILKSTSLSKETVPAQVILPASKETASLQKVNTNTADAKQMATLKGIGPKKAEAIISYREKHGSFKSIDDLAMVPGFSRHSLTELLKKNPELITIS